HGDRHDRSRSGRCVAAGSGFRSRLRSPTRPSTRTASTYMTPSIVPSGALYRRPVSGIMRCRRLSVVDRNGWSHAENGCGSQFTVKPTYCSTRRIDEPCVVSKIQTELSFVRPPIPPAKLFSDLKIHQLHWDQGETGNSSTGSAVVSASGPY